ADRNLRMQVGDKIVVVGPEEAVDRAAAAAEPDPEAIPEVSEEDAKAARKETENR
ncbi:MAG: hypothetical protein HUK22_02565, partial [Thermoguttaceae bacterium]|nr:hypothetical protein [Thermoguttaceae bacterium]